MIKLNAVLTRTQEPSTMQVRELRNLNSQAEEMLVRAKALYAQAEAATDTAEKDRLKREADEWAKRAKELAGTVSRLIKAS
jgi:hypothetical protein